MKVQVVQPQFVELMPKKLEDGILYISERFRTASHRCCCGCGTKIVTPLRPTEFTLTRRGDLVSLVPSIGNWNHPCQSHYWIRDSQVVWAGRMSPAEIQRGRAYDDAQRDAYLGKVAWPWWRRSARWIKDLVKSVLAKHMQRKR